MDYNEIISFESLYKSVQKCRKGVSWKDSVMSFCLNGVERTMVLEQELQNGTYRPRPTRSFRITAPKPRDIISVAFRDRVYQRSLNDYALYPAMTQSFIYDNWACQQGKDPLAARKRFEKLLRRYYQVNGFNGYVAQFDIKGYYPHMRHDVAERNFREKLPRDIAEAAIRIMRQQYPGEVGYNPGSQMIQIAGISMLDKLDHCIKERLRMKTYIRYMDDFILVHPSEAYLKQCAAFIKDALGEIGLELHPTKTRIFPLENGVMFLGFRFRLTDTGKVVRTINPQNVKAERKKLVRLVAKCKRGEVSHFAVDQSYQGWRAHASYGDNYKLLLKMDEFYQSLWRDEHGIPDQG